MVGDVSGGIKGIYIQKQRKGQRKGAVLIACTLIYHAQRL